MQIWAGLGNPGAQYSLHRHNVGFMAVDAIAELTASAPGRRNSGAWCPKGGSGATRCSF